MGQKKGKTPSETQIHTSVGLLRSSPLVCEAPHLRGSHASSIRSAPGAYPDQWLSAPVGTDPSPGFSWVLQGFPLNSALSLPCGFNLGLPAFSQGFQAFHLCRVPCRSTAYAGLWPVSLVHFSPSGSFTLRVSASVASACRSCLLVKASAVCSTCFVCPTRR